MDEKLYRLQSRLAREEGLSLPWAAIVAEDALYRFEPELRGAALDWLEDRLDPNFAVNGVSVAEIREETAATPFQALCILDSLTKDPARLQGAVWKLWRDDLHV